MAAYRSNARAVTLEFINNQNSITVEFLYLKCGLHFLCSVVADIGKHADPDDEKMMFSIFSIDLYGYVLGLRFFRIRTEEDEGIDDFFDRALVGLSFCHGQIIFEILFIRLMLG